MSITVLQTINNQEFLIDSEDSEKVQQYEWEFIRNRIISTYPERINLERLIMNTFQTVVHLNEDKTDNRKENLVIARPSQQRPRKPKTIERWNGSKFIRVPIDEEIK